MTATPRTVPPDAETSPRPTPDPPARKGGLPPGRGPSGPLGPAGAAPGCGSMALPGGGSTVIFMNEPIRLQYHPNGYPALGLVPRTFTARYRKDANLRTLRRRLERWEVERGSPFFQARNLEKINPKLAFELVNVYVAMRERYPQIRPDFIDFASEAIGDDAMAEAFSYNDNLPTVRRIMSNYHTHDVLDGEDILEIAKEENVDSQTLRKLRREVRAVDEETVRDPSTSGSIFFGDAFRNSRTYRKLLKFWDLRNQRAAERGHAPRTIWGGVSPASFTLIHEFGHLVEAELMCRGYKPLERVYRRLSEIVLGSKNPGERQWRYHLVNYPTYDFTKIKGKCQGGPERRRETRKFLHHTIREKLGTYATTYRDELFAESFAQAHGGAKTGTRQEFRPFLQSLKAEGIGAKRLPNR
jgi:hypothetical protein